VSALSGYRLNTTVNQGEGSLPKLDEYAGTCLFPEMLAMARHLCRNFANNWRNGNGEDVQETKSHDSGLDNFNARRAKDRKSAWIHHFDRPSDFRHGGKLFVLIEGSSNETRILL